MKQLILSLILFVCNNISFGQTADTLKNNNDTNRIFSKVDTEASFTGGEKSWRHFLELTVNEFVPKDHNAFKGSYLVVVKFLVSKDGSVSDITCENDPGFGTCQEAIAAIKKSNKWIPAKVKGRYVNAYHRQSFKFKG